MYRGLYRHHRRYGSLRGPNLLPDGDAEDLGVGAWTAVGCILTKDLTAPYEGLQWLRVTSTGGIGRAVQTATVVGQTYRITGACRGDGAVVTWVYNPSATPSALIFASTASTAWQPFDETFIAGHGQMWFYVRGAAPGDFTGFDGLYLSLES